MNDQFWKIPKCVICGFPKNSGIHLPALTGPRKGKPWGHEFSMDNKKSEPNLPTTKDTEGK